MTQCEAFTNKQVLDCDKKECLAVVPPLTLVSVKVGQPPEIYFENFYKMLLIITGLARPATLKLTPLHYQSKAAVRREAGARTVVYKKKRLMTPPPPHHHDDHLIIV